MAPSLVQTNKTGTSASGASLAATLSSGTTVGNLVVAHLQSGTNAGGPPVITPPAGWSTALTESGSNAVFTGMYFLKNCSAGLTSFTFSVAPNCEIVIILEEWSGCDTASPLGVTVGAESTTTAVASGTSAGSAAAGDLALFCVGYNQSSTALTYSAVTSGYTASSQNTAQSGGGTPQVNLAAWHQVLSSGGTQAAGLTLSAVPSGGGGHTGIVLCTFAAAATGLTETEVDSQSLTESLVAALVPTTADTLSVSDAQAEAFTPTTADSQALADAQVEAFVPTTADSQVNSDAGTSFLLLRLWTVADSQTLGESSSLKLVATRADSQTLGEALVAAFTTSVADSLANRDSFTGLPAVPFADSQASLHDALLATLAHTSADVLGVLDSAVIALSTSLADSQALGESALRALVPAATADSQTLAEALAVTPTVGLADSQASSDSTSKSLTPTAFADAQTLLDTGVLQTSGNLAWVGVDTVLVQDSATIALSVRVFPAQTLLDTIVWAYAPVTNDTLSAQDSVQVPFFTSTRLDAQTGGGDILSSLTLTCTALDTLGGLDSMASALPTSLADAQASGDSVATNPWWLASAPRATSDSLACALVASLPTDAGSSLDGVVVLLPIRWPGDAQTLADTFGTTWTVLASDNSPSTDARRVALVAPLADSQALHESQATPLVPGTSVPLAAANTLATKLVAAFTVTPRLAASFSTNQLLQ